MPGGGIRRERTSSASPSSGNSNIIRTPYLENNTNNNNNIYAERTTKDLEADRHRSESRAAARMIRERFGEDNNTNNNTIFSTSTTTSFRRSHHSSSRNNNNNFQDQQDVFRTSIHSHYNNNNNHTNNNNNGGIFIDDTDDDGFALPRRPSSSRKASRRNSSNHVINNNHHAFRSNQSSHSRIRSRRVPGQPVFSGLLSAPVSPFDPQTGRCDSSVITDYAELHRRDGVNGVFCCGTTGESMSLTVRERMECAAAWVDTGLQVAVHVGTQSLIDTQKLARHAQDCGADGIAVMIPFTIAKAATLDTVVEYLEEVYKAAPEIPMLVYHFPTLTNLPFKLYDILTKASPRIPTLCGAKFTSFDLADYAACQSLGGNITDMIYSIEGNLVGAAFLGARTFVGMQFSMIAPIYRRSADAARRGDTDRAQQENRRASDFMLMMSKCGGNSIEKCVAITKYVTGYRLGREIGEPRLPGARLSVDEKDKVRRLLFPFFDRVDVASIRRKERGVMNDDGDDANHCVISPSILMRRRPSYDNNNNNNNDNLRVDDGDDQDPVFRASINYRELEAYSPGGSRGSSHPRRRSSIINTNDEEDDEDYDRTRSPRYNNKQEQQRGSSSYDGHDSQSKYKLIM